MENVFRSNAYLPTCVEYKTCSFEMSAASSDVPLLIFMRPTLRPITIWPSLRKKNNKKIKNKSKARRQAPVTEKRYFISADNHYTLNFSASLCVYRRSRTRHHQCSYHDVQHMLHSDYTERTGPRLPVGIVTIGW